MTHQPHQNEDATLKPLASNPSAPECSCGHSLAAGAYGGWWCPVHKDMRPVKYAVDAVREVNEKYLAAANAAPLRPKPACTKCGDSGWKPNLDANGERVWTPLMNDALPCECGALALKIVPQGYRAVPIKKLVKITSLIDPAPFEANGKNIVFKNPNAAEVLTRLSAEIRELLEHRAPEVLDLAGVCAVLEWHFGKGAPMAGNLAAALDATLQRATGGMQGRTPASEHPLLKPFDDPATGAAFAEAMDQGKGAAGVQGAQPARPERWIVALETAVQIPGKRRPTLGYTVFADAEPFDSFEAASAFIKANNLPLGWVAMQDTHTPWPALFPQGMREDQRG